MRVGIAACRMSPDAGDDEVYADEAGEDTGRPVVTA